MHHSGNRIRSQSVEYIDSFHDFKVEELEIEKCVRNPDNEFIAVETDQTYNLLIALAEKKRQIINFQSDDDSYTDSIITLRGLMETLEIQYENCSFIVAFKKCKQNILYGIEMERGSLFCLDNIIDNELVITHNSQSDVSGTSVKEIEIEKETSVSEIKIENIVTEKQNLSEQSNNKKGKNFCNFSESKKPITSTHKESRPQIIAQYIVGGIVTYSFYMDDYYCLQKEAWLNDLIIDWYLIHLYNKVISSSDRERTFIYSALFFGVLRNGASETEHLQYGSKQRFQKVRQFTQTINIFEKDFVIIPVNENYSHWYLMIICFPSLVDNYQIDDASESMSNLSLTNDDDNDEKKSPCILIFDSLRNSKKINDESLIREYLSFQYYEIYSKKKNFTQSNLSCEYPSGYPKQSNNSDCGIFVLQYVESFFKNPIKNFTAPIKPLNNWFSSEKAQRKRAILAHLLRKMSRETVGKDTPIVFPKLQFG